MRHKSLQYKPPKKSIGEQVMEDLVMLAIISFLVYVICGFFKVLFWPLRYLFMTAEEIDQEDIKKALEKKWARTAYLNQMREDPTDPMNEYLDRFVRNPEQFADDPDNDEYLKWYLIWREGKVLDSRLRWAPDVYLNEDEKNYLNIEFVNYLEIQYKLHLRAGWSSRHCFLDTIRKYFPEVTPRFSAMEFEIEELKERAKTRLLKRELAEELRKLGLPEHISEALSKQKINGKELLTKAKVVKRCIEYGFEERAALFIANKGYEPDGEIAQIANHLLSKGCPEYLAEPFLDGNIDKDELLEVLKFRTATYDLLGEGALETKPNGMTYAEDAFRKKLAEVKAKKKKRAIDEKAGKTAWQA